MAKKIGIIVGSIRKDAYSRKVAQQMRAMFPPGYMAEIIEIAHLPLYNQDYDEINTPESYAPFRQAIAALDGVLFVTPEHNRSVPAALKNALDVASRPYGSNKWSGHPAAVVSVSISKIGGFGANHHLRQSLVFLNVPTVQQPEAYIPEVPNLLDEQGNLNNPDTRQFLQSVVDALVKLVG